MIVGLPIAAAKWATEVSTLTIKSNCSQIAAVSEKLSSLFPSATIFFVACTRDFLFQKFLFAICNSLLFLAGIENSFQVHASIFVILMASTAPRNNSNPSITLARE